jgi:hypothetical protein
MTIGVRWGMLAAVAAIAAVVATGCAPGGLETAARLRALRPDEKLAVLNVTRGLT